MGVLLFLNSLEADLRLWDAVLPLLPQGNCYIDMTNADTGYRPAPAPMQWEAVHDVEAWPDHLNVKDALFVGLSIGGMIAQGLAVKRMDLVVPLVLSNRRPKSANPHCERIASMRFKNLVSRPCLMR